MAGGSLNGGLFVWLCSLSMSSSFLLPSSIPSLPNHEFSHTGKHRSDSIRLPLSISLCLTPEFPHLLGTPHRNVHIHSTHSCGQSAQDERERKTVLKGLGNCKKAKSWVQTPTTENRTRSATLEFSLYLFTDLDFMCV